MAQPEQTLSERKHRYGGSCSLACLISAVESILFLHTGSRSVLHWALEKRGVPSGRHAPGQVSCLYFQFAKSFPLQGLVTTRNRYVFCTWGLCYGS